MLVAVFRLSASSAQIETSFPTGHARSDAPVGKVRIEQFMTGASVFVQNNGQWSDPAIKFALDGFGANAGITEEGLKYQLFRASNRADWRHGTDWPDPSVPQASSGPETHFSQMHEFGLVFDGAAATIPLGRGKSERTFNYLPGDASTHRASVPSFNAVWYDNLYPGISLELTGHVTGLKYTFHVAAGANPHVIRLRFEGIETLSLTEDGGLEIHPAPGWQSITDSMPYIYQEMNGIQRAVWGHFILLDDHTFGFEIIGAYDARLPLIIDPAVEWGSYLGGSNADYGYGAAADANGNCFVTGYTNSSGWVSYGWNTALSGASFDGFIIKFNADGQHQWSTYLGGTGVEHGYAIAVDSSGNCYAIGETSSSGWVSGGFDPSYNGAVDGYVVKLNSDGQHLWSTFLGGANDDFGWGIAVDGSGNCYVTGYSDSSGWVSGGFDPSHNGAIDGYIAKLNTDGQHLWSTFFGGANDDHGQAIAVDGSGNCYATGRTDSSGWVSGGWDTTYGGTFDGYIITLNTAGQHLWSSFLGGTGLEYGRGIAVDSSGNSFSTGYSASSGWVSGGWKTTYTGTLDGYAVKLDANGAHQWSTYLGGNNFDYGQSITLDAAGNCYASGYSSSSSWVSGGWDITNNGSSDTYIVKLSTGGLHLWSSFLGGSGSDMGYGIAAANNGICYISGITVSSGWLSNGWDTSFNGGAYDGYLVKIVQEPAPPANPGAIAIDTDTITWTWTDASSNESGFKVYDDPGASDPVTLRATTLDNTQFWQHIGLPPNTQHSFQVAATNSDGDSGKTPTFSAWTLAARPLLPAITNLCSRSFDVTLNPSDTNPAGTEYAISVVPVITGTVFWVQWDGSLGTTPAFQFLPAWATITVTGLTPDQPHLVFAAARNGAGVHSDDGMIAFTTTLEGTPPTASLSTAAPNPVNGAITVDVTLSENSTSFSEGSITALDASVSNFSGSNAAYSFTLTPTLTMPGAFSCHVPAGAFSDLACNPSEADSNILTRNYDRWPPTVSLSCTAPYYVQTPMQAAALLSEPSVTFESGDIATSNATVNSFSAQPDGVTFFFQLIPVNQGAFSCQIPVGTFADFAGNANVDASGTIDRFYDSIPPEGMVLINDGADYTQATTVTLTLSANDGTGSGVTGMQFSNDNTTWPGWEPFATTKTWNLITGDGEKTVYAQFRDAAGFVSTGPVSDMIFLDMTPPVCAFVINDDNEFTNFSEVSLSISASDSGTGLLGMRFSDNTLTWGSWETCAPAVRWTIPAGEGTRTVYGSFRDTAGNSSSACSDAITLITVETVVDPPMAAAGEDAMIRFRIVDRLSELPIVTVNGHLADPIGGKDDTEYLYRYTLLDPAQDPPGPAEIIITCIDLNENVAIFTSNNLTITSINTMPLTGLPTLAGLTLICAAAGALILRRKE